MGGQGNDHGGSRPRVSWVDVTLVVLPVRLVLLVVVDATGLEPALQWHRVPPLPLLRLHLPPVLPVQERAGEVHDLRRPGRWGPSLPAGPRVLDPPAPGSL